MASPIEHLINNFSFSSFHKAKELKKRLLFTLIALIIYRFGTYVPLPGINMPAVAEYTARNSEGLLGVLNLFSGGSIMRMAIFSLNIVPYITASIIMQLMQTMSPTLEALKKDGERGRQTLNQYTRYLAIAIALFQGFAAALILEKVEHGNLIFESGWLFRITTTTSLTCGTLFIMWLGEQIAARGIGNGSSMIIYTGIVAGLPKALSGLFDSVKQGSASGVLVGFLVVMIVALMVFIVFMEKATRNLPIQYPKRQVSMVGYGQQKQQSILPLKLNNAGVIPAIFASSLLLLPLTIANFANISHDSWFRKIANMMGHGKPLYIALYLIAMVFFTFFYTAMMFNPTETAENLKKSGTYIPGIRPGDDTARYLDFVLTRITVIGALYLCIVCIIPELLLTSGGFQMYFGGTSLLIIVSVTNEIISQAQSYLMVEQYSSLFKKKK